MSVPHQPQPVRKELSIAAIRQAFLFIVITGIALSSAYLHAQAITTYAPPASPAQTSLPEDPSKTVYPAAITVHQQPAGETVVLESTTQSESNGVFLLDGAVTVTYRDRTLNADHIEYDSTTGNVTANGHLVVTGGANGERITAARGELNLKTETGRFYDVTGSVGFKPSVNVARRTYTNGQPFLFTGRMVVKRGARSYDIYDGTVTSCQLTRPDWILTAAHFSVDEDQARASNSVFRLLNLPVLYLPYVTHPLDPEDRQSGFLIPTAGQSSTKGFIVGEQIYFVINRSADLTVGTEYYSSRGFSQNATFRYRGSRLDFFNAHYTGLLDRRSGKANQGGEDMQVGGRHDFRPGTEVKSRVAANVDYLSSYIYREAFTENFNQAVTSDIVSTIYGVHQAHGVELAALADRYQGIKLIAQGTTPQQQVRLFHVPSLLLATTEHPLGRTRLEVSMDASASGLKRSQPAFVTGGIVERFDVHPQVSLPFALGAWRMRPTIGGRETFYNRSRIAAVRGQSIQESLASLSRSDVEFAFGLRAPVLERTFVPTRFTSLLGRELRHTVAAEADYRLVQGISNFTRVLRFDAIDVASNTNEVEYGVVQRVYRRRATDHSCGTGSGQFEVAPEIEAAGGLNPDVTPSGTCGGEELISWRLTQRYFFDPNFGGAINNGRRNLFETTLDLSGIAFLTEPRNISPLISRLRVRTSAHTDVEWDFDLDTGAKKFTSSNVLLDLHAADGVFGAVSYARLDAPGRFYTENASGSTTTGVVSQISDFNQLRVLLGYGSPVKPGFSVAANTGLDLKSLYGATATTTSGGITRTRTAYPALLQYAAVQTSYNWNCCGLSVEYRKFELGSVRNEGSYRFNFTLANVGTAGNLRRAERLF